MKITLSLLPILALLLCQCSQSSSPEPLTQKQAGYHNKGLKRASYKIRGKRYTPMSVEAALCYDQVGLASHYDGAGGRTAMGERPKRGQLYAAHKTLPLPCEARISCPKTGRSCIVRINDRGPFIKGRIIDVSREVAKKLAFGKQGIKPLRVQVLSVGDGVNKQTKRGEI